MHHARSNRITRRLIADGRNDLSAFIFSYYNPEPYISVMSDQPRLKAALTPTNNRYSTLISTLYDCTATPCLMKQSSEIIAGRLLHRRKYIPVIGLAISLFIGMATYAGAASFDCGKTASRTEQMICADATLSVLDDKLTETYKTALSVINTEEKPALLREQRNWLQFTRDICDNSNCLRNVYASRIAILARNERNIVDPISCITPTGESICQTVVLYRDTSSHITSFNQSLRDHGQKGRILSCSIVLGVPTGVSGHNVRHGGSCMLRKNNRRNTVFICNDEMIGQFAIEPANVTTDMQRKLVDFTINCPGG